MCATIYNRVCVVKLLLDQPKIKVNAGSQTETSLDLATMYNYEEIAAMLRHKVSKLITAINVEEKN